MRFFVGTPSNLELVRLALDQANGYRDALGVPVRTVHKIFRGGVQVGVIDSDVYNAQTGTAPTTTVGPAIVGDDGSAALELPVAAEVDGQLGKTVRGFALPQPRDLVAEDALAGDVARVVDDAIVSGLPAEVTVARVDDRTQLSVDARARVLEVEVRIGVGRLRAAVQRRGGAQSRAALDAAAGLGRVR